MVATNPAATASMEEGPLSGGRARTEDPMVRLVALLRPVPLVLASLIVLCLIVLAAMYGSTASTGDGSDDGGARVSTD